MDFPSNCICDLRCRLTDEWSAQSSEHFKMINLVNWKMRPFQELWSLVVDRTHYSRIFQFPLRNSVKISEHAPNFNVFKPRLVCRRILILPSGSSGKKFRFFNNLTHTANLVIGLKFRKNLKFSKKSEILGFEKFRENYFNFFVL